MSDSNATVPPTGFRTELGHLAVKVDGLRPAEMPFLFERKPERMGGALASSSGVHAAGALMAVLLTLYGPRPQIASPRHPIGPTRTSSGSARRAPAGVEVEAAIR